MTLRKKRGNSDYINASWIRYGENNKQVYRQYIATQCCTLDTIAAFWAAMMENKVNRIVFAVPLGIETVEKNGKIYNVCERYWPKDVGTTMQYGDGDIHVHYLDEKEEKSHVLRTFKVKLGKKERIIYQFHINGWKDFEIGPG